MTKDMQPEIEEARDHAFEQIMECAAVYQHTSKQFHDRMHEIVTQLADEIALYLTYQCNDRLVEAAQQAFANVTLTENEEVDRIIGS